MTEKIDNGDGFLVSPPGFIDGDTVVEQTLHGCVAVTGSDWKQAAIGSLFGGEVTFLPNLNSHEPRFSSDTSGSICGHLARNAKWKVVQGLRRVGRNIGSAVVIAHDNLRVTEDKKVLEKSESLEEARWALNLILSGRYFFVGFGYFQLEFDRGGVANCTARTAFVVARTENNFGDFSALSLEAPGGLDLRQPEVLERTSVLCERNGHFGLAISEKPEISLMGISEWVPFSRLDVGNRPQAQLVLCGGLPPVDEFLNLARRGLQRT